MKTIVIKVLATLLVFGLTAQFATAACTKASIKGNYAGEGNFPETGDFHASNAVLMLFFNGSGGLAVKKVVEGARGSKNVLFGGGSYTLQPNCTGLATIKFKQNGVVVSTGKMDFVVGGTKALPQIMGLYTNSQDKSSGNVRLIKSVL